MTPYDRLGIAAIFIFLCLLSFGLMASLLFKLWDLLGLR